MEKCGQEAHKGGGCSLGLLTIGFREAAWALQPAANYIAEQKRSVVGLWMAKRHVQKKSE